MRRRIFIKAVEQFHTVLVKGLILKNIPESTAKDVVQDMVERAIRTKSYVNLKNETIDNRLRSYLMQATKWELIAEQRRQLLEGSRIAQLGEEDEDGDQIATILKEPTVDDIIVCPFCHVGVLNQFGACAECHTILGKSKGPVEVLSMEKMVESECPDLGMFADVNTALGKLDEFERKVVLAIVHGNSTLEDLAELTRIPRTQLWRIWTRAKAKLQQELYEYSHVNN